MKLRILTMCLWMDLCLSVQAQMQQDAFHPLVKEGKFWKTEMVEDWARVKEYTHYIEGDTLIGGVQWKKVYSNISGDAYSYYAAVREEGQKVYAIADGKECSRLLYNFDLKVGDKVTCISEGTALGFYYILDPDEEYHGWATCMELKNIDIINVGGQELRRFIFKSNYMDKSMDFSYPTLVWVEGVGSEGGLFQSWNKPTLVAKVSCYVKDELIFDADDFHVSDETVDIHDCYTEIKIHDNVFYDLTGRPVSTPTKGVYIRNGKKVLVNK